MSLHKKDSRGYYDITFSYNGKRYRVRGRTKDEVLEKVSEKKEELKKGFDAIYNPTLSEYYEHFSDIRRNEIQGSTLRSQRSQIKSVLEHKQINDTMFGDMPIKDITRRDIERVRNEMLKKGKTPENLNNMFSHLNHVLNSAFIDETIERNPCKSLKPLKRSKPLVKETKHRALTREETRKFFETASERNSYYYNAFLFMIKSGLRIGELTALIKEDFDTDKGYIHIHKTTQRNEYGVYIVADTTKTKSGKRDIPLTNELLEIAEAQEELNEMIFDNSKCELIFRSPEDSILRDYTLNREIERICNQANIEYFTCHAFRNTFATRWIEQKPEDYKILSEILGHKDVSITLNLYTHVMQDVKKNAMNSIRIDID